MAPSTHRLYQKVKYSQMQKKVWKWIIDVHKWWSHKGQIVPVVVSYSYNISTDTIFMQYLAASVTKEPCTYKFHCVHHILRQLARTIYKYFCGLQITMKRDSVLQKIWKHLHAWSSNNCYYICTNTYMLRTSCLTLEINEFRCYEA